MTLLVMLVVPSMTLRAAPLGGTLTGKVVMKTAGASLPTPPLTVTILSFNSGLFRSSDESADARTAMTAPDGSFTFSGLDTTQAGVYRVLVQYKGVAYEPAERDLTDASGATGKSRAVRFTNNATSVTTDVPIYEPQVADTPTGFTVTSHQIIINEVRPQFYSVLEALQISNPGDRTLVGALNPDGSVAQGVALPFTMPQPARTISTNRIDLIPGADVTGQKLTLRAPIQPGGSDVTATYDMPGTPNGLSYQRTLDFPATKVQVLVSDTKQAIASQTLKDDGQIQAPQASSPFRQFSLNNAKAGQQIALMIAPSPSAPIQATPTAANKSAFARFRDTFTAPLLLALAFVCLVLMILILRAPVKSTESAAANTRGTTRKRAVTPMTDGVEAKEASTAQPATAVSESSGKAVRRARGRPHDDDLDDAEREIEAANAKAEETRNDRA